MYPCCLRHSYRAQQVMTLSRWRLSQRLALWRCGELIKQSTPVMGPGRCLHAPLHRRCSFRTSASSQGRPLQLPRFYIGEPLKDRPAGCLVKLDAVESRHTKTLRLLEGAHIELCDGRGAVVIAEVASVSRDGVVARTVAEAQQVPLQGWQWQVAAACGSLKGGRADWLVEKCVELGAAGFIPLLTERSPVIGSGGNVSSSGSSASKKHGKKQSGQTQAVQQEEAWPGDASEAGGREGRWERLATAALKQSLRAHAMRVYSPCSVQALCTEVSLVDTALIGVAGAQPVHEVAAMVQLVGPQQQARLQQRPQPPPATQEGNAGIQPCNTAWGLDSNNVPQSGASLSLNGGRSSSNQSSSAVGSLGAGSKRGLLIVGPEGDFTPEELEQLVAAGAKPVGLGDLRLRAETAAVALLAYVRLQLVDS